MSDSSVFDIPADEPEVRALELVESSPAFLDIEGSVQLYRQLVDFVRRVLVVDVDYGTIQGTQKPALYKPGSEKLRQFFNYRAPTTLSNQIEDYKTAISETEFPFFNYTYITRVYNSGDEIVSCEGSCNSYEEKYRWRWVPSDQVPKRYDLNLLESREDVEWIFKFAVESKAISGKYGHPIEYYEDWERDIQSGKAIAVRRKDSNKKEWDAYERVGLSFRIPNDRIFDQLNTLRKMGQKRSFVGALILATGASQFFTQDIDDMAAHFATEDISIRMYVPDADSAKRKLIAYVRKAGVQDAGQFIKSVLEEKELPFSLDNWADVLDAIDERIEVDEQ